MRDKKLAHPDTNASIQGRGLRPVSTAGGTSSTRLPYSVRSPRQVGFLGGMLLNKRSPALCPNFIRPILYAKGVAFQSPGSANDVVVSATLGHIGRSPSCPERVVLHCVVEPFQGSGLCGHLTQGSSQSLATPGSGIQRLQRKEIRVNRRASLQE
jgi:hypothetical protein